MLLGKRVATYRPLPPSPLLLSLWGLLAFLLLSQALPAIGASVDPSTAGWITLLLVAGVGCWLQRPRLLHLHQQGIEYRVGRRSHRLFWNQIYEVYQIPIQLPQIMGVTSTEPRRTPSCLYRIVKRDGRTVYLARFESLGDLGQRIQQQIADRQLPNAIDAFRAGYLVRFGRRMALSQDGIHLRGRLYRWSEVTEIRMDETSDLQIYVQGRARAAAKIAIGRVPNLVLLDQLLRVSQEMPDQLEEDELGLLRSAFFESPPPASASTFFEDGSGNVLLDGYDWQDLDGVDRGELTIDDLLQRGARHRPRQPR